MRPSLTPSEPTSDEVQYLDNGVYEYNSSVTGIGDGRWLAFFLRDESGRIVAGICGNTWGSVCESVSSGSRSHIVIEGSAPGFFAPPSSRRADAGAGKSC